MYRVLSCLAAKHNVRLADLAITICATAVATASVAGLVVGHFAGLAATAVFVSTLIVCTATLAELQRARTFARRNGELVAANDRLQDRESELNLRIEQLDAQKRDLLAQEQGLRERNNELATAIDNMAQGVVMFDADARLVMCNRRFGEIHALPSDLLQPGAPLQTIMAQTSPGGQSSRPRPESVGASVRAGGEQARKVVRADQREDGRTIESSVQTLDDGRSVVTYTDITELRRSMAKIAHMAMHDPLTGLINRRQFIVHIDEALVRQERTGAPFAVIILDLDLFTKVNETLGFKSGDQLLQIVAERLREVTRDTDIVARLTGDRFAVLAERLAQAADATLLGQRITDVLSVPYVIDGHQVVMSASVGITLAPHDATDIDQLICNAELAMRRAKADGRNACRFFQAGMDARMHERRALEADLRAALEGGEFELHFQPVVNLARNSISGMEALIRWRHPAKNLVPPGSFIPFAEESGLIVPIGRWVIREACAAAAKWPASIKVAVNISSAQLRDPELIATIRLALANNDLAAERLELEITESILLERKPETMNALKQLRDMGVRIALDDFGTGYSSLSYLQMFPFDKIKIDRIFVKDITEKVDSLHIVRAVASLADGLGMETTVEGVETQEQLESVRAQRCTEVQGYFVSKPMPAGEVADFMAAFDASALHGPSSKAA